MTPEARSRKNSRTGFPARHRGTRSPRSRTVFPTGYREAGRNERDIFLHDTRRKARDELLEEIKRQAK